MTHVWPGVNENTHKWGLSTAGTRSMSIGEIAVVKAGMQLDVSGSGGEGKMRRKHLPGSPWVSFLHQCSWRAPNWTELLSPPFCVVLTVFYAWQFHTVIIWNRNYLKSDRSPFHSSDCYRILIKTQKTRIIVYFLTGKKIKEKWTLFTFTAAALFFSETALLFQSVRFIVFTFFLRFIHYHR